MKKLISLALVMALGAGLVSCDAALDTPLAESKAETIETTESSASEEKNSEGKHEITSESYPLYMNNDPMGMDLKLYFLDGVKDLPYIESEDIHFLINDAVLGDEEAGISFSMEKDGSIVTYTRHNKDENAFDNDIPLTFDFDKKTIDFMDFDLFCKSPKSSTLLDMTSMNVFNEKGEPAVFKKVDRGSLDRYGDSLVLSLGDYGIDMIMQDGLYLVPLQTVNDFLIAAPCGANLFFNGKSLILTAKVSECEDLYYAGETGERSDALIEYGYNELCLMLDYLYGLKEPHEIKHFAELFHENGLEPVLKMTDTENADRAIYRMINDYLDDGHSQFTGYSYLSGKSDYKPPKGASEFRWGNHYERYLKAREKFYPDGIPGYEEVGNTAYITFDQFYMDDTDGEAYYKVEDPKDFSDENTIELIMKAHSMITRENSPIENVVIDLSCNLGGVADTAVFTLGWFLGEASIGMKNTMTGAMCSSTYRCDVNRDREFDEKDELGDRRLFCLTSPVSFSCGNLVPCIFKESNRVTLLGRTSGGGSCVVEPVSSAWGTSFQLSGIRRISFVMNGAFYDVDRGAEPDYSISTPEQYYDRKALTEYINSIY
ncbi:S41 family peptidase [Oribacterium sp. WCC10]|uniref:S41 family peptidase n=1 Tax=Oribacterium sp. WCC10 TaxID=1855343 RepID=UPI0008EEB4E6|nr:S41 family peptidase [Oribacterium sp. WCC10]SFG19952.1 Peptidase family S41 [Oribacterium sp. WCC10]